MYSMWKIMCFFNPKPHKHISLHQIHKIMLFLETSYDPFKTTLTSINQLGHSDWRKKQVREPKESKQKVVSSQPTAVRNGQAVSAGSAAPTGPYIKRITNDDREDEMEENLSQFLFIKSRNINVNILFIYLLFCQITTITSEVAAAEKHARKHKRNTERTTKS
uniref:Synaptosomal-associated protein n=1 Tax=Sinocyclocheilus rhinocerous TaxID=307959 RepID=A0A673M5M9_9TELE